MKKIMMFAAMAAAVMVSFNACQKDNSNKGHHDDDDDEPTFVSKIKIDGDFADWDALDAAKVSVTECTEGTKFTALKKAKVYADEAYVNVYLEFDEAQLNKEYVPVHLYFNYDNSDKTGGYGDEFIDANADIVLENAIISGNEYVSFDPALFKWWGEVGGSGWIWSDPSITPAESNHWGAILTNGSGIATGSGKDGKYEIQVTREMIPNVTFADTFTMGFDIQSDWTSVGVLPNAPMDEQTNPNGLAKKLVVTIDK